jgi:hypothetical protein
MSRQKNTDQQTIRILFIFFHESLSAQFKTVPRLLITPSPYSKTVCECGRPG